MTSISDETLSADELEREFARLGLRVQRGIDQRWYAHSVTISPVFMVDPAEDLRDLRDKIIEAIGHRDSGSIK